MKYAAKRIISCIIVAFMLCIVMMRCTYIAQNKVSYRKTAPFFEYKDEFDVLFLGTSHVKLGILPMELWDEYGITSYNFGCSSSHIPTSYWILRNALDYSKPKVVVVDCWGLSQPAKTDATFAFVHEAFDAFPLTATKVRTAFDLLDDPAAQSGEEGIQGEKPTKLGLLWNYSVYHKRWGEIGQDDFEPKTTVGYGGELRSFISKPIEFADKGDPEALSDDIVGRQYLERMIEECKEKDIEVLLTYLPYCVSNGNDWNEMDAVRDIAKKYDLGYIDFFEENIVNFNTDLADNTHLNPSGSWKVTEYIGDYLKMHYRLDDHRSDSRYDHWRSDYEVYSDYKMDILKTATDLNTYLMMLEDGNYRFDIAIGDEQVFNDSVTMELLDAKGIYVDVNDFETNNKGRVIVNVFRQEDPENMIDTSVFARPQNIDIPEEYAGRYATRYEVSESEGKINIVYYELYNPDNVINTVTVSIPQGLGFNDRLPNTLGTTFQNSMAVRVAE